MKKSVPATVVFFCVCVLVFPATSFGLKISRIMSYRSTVSSDAGGPLDLKAELNYNTSILSAPVVVVMHGYSPVTNFNDVRLNAQRLRDAGFFTISVAMRGRDGSDGVRDSGGVEIFDIYDAVEAAKTQYAAYVNPANISITGYSGGGGNAMSALTKFPDYFRAGSSYFGISDYGHNPVSGWYFNGAAASHQAQMVTDIGNPTLGNPLILDRYAARNSNLASKNNPYSEIHLFVNYNETVCPPINHDLYKSNAVSNASYAGQFNNINVHIGGYGEYVDFNNNGVNESSELQDWPHGFPTSDQQRAAETWYLNRLLTGQIAQPVLNNSDSLYVAGFIKTKKFSLWLGDGQNAAANLDYALSAEEKTFAMHILASDRNVTGKLEINVQDMAGQTVFVSLNGITIDQIAASAMYVYNQLRDGDTLTLSITQGQPGIEGDINRDEAVDILDFQCLAKVWELNQAVGLKEDLSKDGIIGVEDLVIMADNWFRGKRERFFNASFDSDPNWIAEGQWQLGQPEGLGGISHGNTDPAIAHSDLNVYGVNLHGDYNLQVAGPYRLTAGPIDCRNHKQIALRFERWLNTDEPSYVDSRIEVSNDNVQWNVVWRHDGQKAITDNKWISVEYDLSAFADEKETVYIRWSYEILNERVWPFSGWNIDDVEIWGKKK
jgi:dienelactone hydrolase